MHKLIKIMKKVKIKNMIILILLLMFNAYAWFVYSTKVNMEITAHVSSWNIQFLSDNSDISTNMNIEIGRIYPGMEGNKKFEKIIEVKNNGEKSAKLSYIVQEINVMGEKNTVNGATEEEVNQFFNKYPFKIKIEVEDEELQQGTGNGKFIVSFEWAFESGNDELDTYWGNKAYEYYAVNPDKNSIEIKLLLNASQKAE